jgi:transcriptional regulator with XRE-family HTH domain
MESHFDPKHRRVRTLLRNIRVEKGLRQIDIAERLGEDQSFVSKYENGERQLDFVEVAEVCEALGISLTDFVRRFEEGAA